MVKDAHLKQALGKESDLPFVLGPAEPTGVKVALELHTQRKVTLIVSLTWQNHTLYCKPESMKVQAVQAESLTPTLVAQAAAFFGSQRPRKSPCRTLNCFHVVNLVSQAIILTKSGQEEALAAVSSF